MLSQLNAIYRSLLGLFFSALITLVQQGHVLGCLLLIERYNQRSPQAFALTDTFLYWHRRNRLEFGSRHRCRRHREDDRRTDWSLLGFKGRDFFYKGF